MLIMKAKAPGETRMLVVIASYGNTNNRHLSRILAEYRSMAYRTDLVVLSNAPKDLGCDVTVIVGLPNKNPWSLPFGHKRLFANHVDDYDLFVYSEDDMLITQANVEAFREAAMELDDSAIPGFLRFEEGPGNVRSYPDMHAAYHWDAEAVRTRGDCVWAFFTNEHAAAYILTQDQLRRAIASGGFLVKPHQGKYDLLCAAATDPYTQCGMQKLICISRLDAFLIHHLPNKYMGKLGIGQPEFDAQIGALLEIAYAGVADSPLLSEHPTFKATHLGKSYYEPAREDLIALIPSEARNVLSVGCGWGATEEQLIRAGRRVIAVPLDPVISACARARGVQVLSGDLRSALIQLGSERFDCLLISNLLHLVKDPEDLLVSLMPLLSDGARVITTVPNLLRLSHVWRRFRGVDCYRALGNYAASGVHFTSRWTVSKWLRGSGLRVERFVDALSGAARASSRLLPPLFSAEIVALAVRPSLSSASQ